VPSGQQMRVFRVGLGGSAASIGISMRFSRKSQGPPDRDNHASQYKRGTHVSRQLLI